MQHLQEKQIDPEFQLIGTGSDFMNKTIKLKENNNNIKLDGIKLNTFTGKEK